MLQLRLGTYSKNKRPTNDSLRIDSNKKHIKAGLNLFKFQDKDTHQWVLFIESLDITSYGETENKAQEMLKETIHDYLQFLMSMTVKERDLELNKLGWEHHKLHNKEYSKSYVDINGNLKDFNAVGDKVERLMLQTA